MRTFSSKSLKELTIKLKIVNNYASQEGIFVLED